MEKLLLLKIQHYKEELIELKKLLDHYRKKFDETKFAANIPTLTKNKEYQNSIELHEYLIQNTSKILKELEIELELHSA